MKTQLYQLSE